MAREESRGKRPFKIWDSWRNVRKSCVVSSLKDLESRGKEKLQICPSEQVRLVLESDGTQVEDGEYFRTLPNNTIILVLRQGERWYPTGVDAIRTAITAIPKIVCETIHALELQDETPSWKIMDNKGRVTVVLHWDQRGTGGGGSGPSPSPQPRRQPHPQPPLLVQTSVDSQGKKETIINDVYPTGRYSASPQITVINHDLDQQRRHHVHLKSGEGGYEECMRAGSPSGGRECDFHCCALHEEGRKIAVHKSVATSPIQDSLSPQHPARSRPQTKAHVRFLDIEGGGAGTRMQQTGREESSESETENAGEEAITSEKFLLLIDQLSVDQKRHLSIKDIGIILERLSSKILDVERLDRESESEDCYNWTIKATIRGDVLRELGVIYNGNYYAISEHPGYKEESEDAREDEQEEDDEEEDRI